MFKNALVYRIADWNQPELTALEEKLGANRFVECGASQAESFGWVEPRGEKNAPMVEVVGGQLVMRLVIETKAVPSSAIKSRLEAELDKIEADTGRRPKGKRAKEMKEQIVHELLPRAFSKRSTTTVWVDAKAKLLVVDAASTKKADRLSLIHI